MSNSPVKTFAIQLLRAVISALIVVFTSRLLGSSGRGFLSLMLFEVNLVMIANEYVGGSSMANLVPSKGVRQLYPTTFLWSLLVLLLYAAWRFLAESGAETSTLLLLYAFSLAQLTIHYSFYQGLGWIHKRNMLQLLLESSKLLALLGLWWISPAGSLQPNDVLAVFLACTFLAFLASEWMLRKEIRGIRPKEKIPVAKSLFQMGFWAQSGQLVQFLNYRLALMILDHFTGLSATGVYSNALLIADTIWIFGNSFGTIAHSRIIRSQNKKFRADLVMRYTAISVAGTGIACLLLLLMPQVVFTTIFGADFSSLKHTAIWLIPAILSLGGSTIFSHYLHAANRFRVLLLANACGLLVQVVVAMLLVPVYGLKGACIGADAGFFAILLMVWSLFRKDNPHVKIHGAFRLHALWKVLVRR